MYELTATGNVEHDFNDRIEHLPNERIVVPLIWSTECLQPEFSKEKCELVGLGESLGTRGSHCPDTRSTV